MNAYIDTKLVEFDIDELLYDIIIDGEHHMAWLDDNCEFVEMHDGDCKRYTKEEIIGNKYQCFAGVWRDAGFIYVYKLNNEFYFEYLN